MNHHTVLLVDDDPGAIQLMAHILRGLAELRFASSGEEALRLARESAPDLILLDAEMDGLSGFQVCEALKADAALDTIPVIFVTSHCQPEFEVAGFEIGAADFVAKPVNPALLLARVRAQLRIKRMADELRRISTIDALTGVANRRRFDDALDREWLRARRSGEPLSLLMVDVDHFKLYNDRYGHPAGDACLRAIAQALHQTSQRPGDVVARVGGEEFALLLPQTPRGGAEHLSQLVLDAVERLALPHAASPLASHVTVSVGIGCYDEDSPFWIDVSPASRLSGGMPGGAGSAADMMRAADQALYAAKRAGRGRAHVLDISDADTPQAAREVQCVALASWH